MQKEVKVGLTSQLFANLALFTPHLFIPQLAESFGATKFEIGLLSTFFSATIFLSSWFFGKIADRIGRQRIIIIGFLASSIAFTLGYFANSYTELLLIRILGGATAGIYPGALTVYIHENKGTMGRFSSFGAIGSAIAQYISGVVATLLGLPHLFIISGISFFISLIFIATGIKKEEYIAINIPLFPINIIKKNKHIYIPLFLRHMGATGIWAFWVLYLGQIGANNYWKRILFTFNYATQFLVMYFIMDRISGKKSIGWELILSAAIFLYFTIVPNYLWIIPAMIATGFAWPFLFTGSLKEIAEKNEERATASGLIQSSISLGNIFGPS